MVTSFDATAPVWHLITRLGEAQILLPIAIGVAWLLWRRGRSAHLALIWAGWVGVVAGITTFSKLAFLGWGVGSAQFDFTGVSGHAMFAAAIYPVLFRLLPGPARLAPLMWHTLTISAGLMLATLVAMSRVMVDAHSVSESVVGLALGLAASALTLRKLSPPSQRGLHLPRWAPAVVAAWLAVLPATAPASITHDLVIRMALSLSGRDAPYQRSDLQRRAAQPLRSMPIDAAQADTPGTGLPDRTVLSAHRA
jgi:membrane-associated phospholipid phosphatase